MVNIIVSEFVTLDGFFEAPFQWSVPYWNDEIASFKHEELLSVGSLLLGRITYEEFAQAWPDRDGHDEYADRMNYLPKYIVSNTLVTAEWKNSHIIKQTVKQDINNLKEGSEKDILVFGSGTLTNYLFEHKLVDEIRFLVYPLFHGKGKRFIDKNHEIKFELLGTKQMDNGVVLMRYKTLK